MRARERAHAAHAFIDHDPWIDDHQVDVAVALVLAGESVVFAGPAGSGTPLYVAAVESQIREHRPDLWKTMLWCPDSRTSTPELRGLVVDAIHRGDRRVVVGLTSGVRADAAAAADPLADELSRTWLDGVTRRIDVGRLSDDALIRIMDRLGSSVHLPLVTRARVIAWSNGVRVVAQQLHAAAVSAGPDVAVQRRAMAGPHLGTALFEAYASLLAPLTPHDQRRLARLVDVERADGPGASAIIDRELTTRLEAARVLSPTEGTSASRVPEPVTRVAAVLWPRDEHPDAAPSRLDDGPAATATVTPCPRVVALFQHTLGMDFSAARELGAAVLAEPSGRPRDRYLAAAGSGLATAYMGEWSESARLFERADLLKDVFPAEISAADQVIGLWLEAFARAFSGADLSVVRERLAHRAISAARAGNDDHEHLTSALSACLHSMAGDAVAAELDLAAVSTPAARNALGIEEWILPIVNLSVATCLALQGDAARADELRHMSREAASLTPLVAWFLSVADTAISHARGFEHPPASAEYASGLLRTGRAGLLLELHALFHIVFAARGGAPSAAAQLRLRELGGLLDAPVAEMIRRSSPDGPTEGDPGAFLLWAPGLWAPSDDDADADATIDGPVDTLGLLSDREREVAMLIASGLSNRAIAERLFLSVRTVESHVYVARQKVGAATRRDLGTMVSTLAAAS